MDLPIILLLIAHRFVVDDIHLLQKVARGAIVEDQGRRLIHHLHDGEISKVGLPRPSNLKNVGDTEAKGQDIDRPLLARARSRTSLDDQICIYRLRRVSFISRSTTCR